MLKLPAAGVLISLLVLACAADALGQEISYDDWLSFAQHVKMGFARGEQWNAIKACQYCSEATQKCIWGETPEAMVIIIESYADRHPEQKILSAHAIAQQAIYELCLHTP